jgi:cell division protease FtsH
MKHLDLVCGYEDIKAELIRIRNVLYNSDKFEKMGVDIPHGLLLYGDYGMGKTLMAECFIKECDLPVFAICKGEPDCDVVNEIRCAFAEAKNAGKAIVFLDNLDDNADANVYAVLKACMDDCQKAGVLFLQLQMTKTIFRITCYGTADLIRRSNWITLLRKIRKKY